MWVPLAPWLWPLLPPALLALVSALLPLLIWWDWAPRDPGALPGVLLGVAALTLGALALVLAPALIALRVLRTRVARDGRVRLRLVAFRGLCLGLSGTVLLWAFALVFGLAAGGGVTLALLLVGSPLLPALGYGVGGWLGRREEAVP